MIDYETISAKIIDLKSKIDNNSVTPLYLGVLLEQLLEKVQDIDISELRGPMTAAIAQAEEALRLSAVATAAKDSCDTLEMLIGEIGLEDIDSLSAIDRSYGRILAVKAPSSSQTQGWLFHFCSPDRKVIQQMLFSPLPLGEDSQAFTSFTPKGSMHVYNRIYNATSGTMTTASGESVGGGQWSRWEDYASNIEVCRQETAEAMEAFGVMADSFVESDRPNLLRLDPAALTVTKDYGLHVAIDEDGKGLTAWHSREGDSVDSEFAIALQLDAGRPYSMRFATENSDAIEKMTLTATQGTYFGTSFAIAADGTASGKLTAASNPNGTAYLSVKLAANKAMDEATAVRLTLGMLCEGRSCGPLYTLKAEAMPDSLRKDEDRAARTTQPASAISINKRIRADLAEGDIVELVQKSWRGVVAFAIPHGATGAWVCGSLDASNPRYAVADRDGRAIKVAARSGKTTDANVGYYVNLEGLTGAKKIYVEVVPNADSTTAFWAYGSDQRTICAGDTIACAMSGNAQPAGYRRHGMDVYRATIRPNSASVRWTLPEAVAGRSIGVWLRLAAFDAVANAPKFYASLYKDGENVGVVEVENTQVLQLGDWVFLKIRTTDKDADAVSLRFVFSSRIPASAEITLEVCGGVIANHFERPAAIIDFDQSWAATDACGAYDALIAGSVPFTITGSISAAEAKLRAACMAGLLDAGSYGGQTNGTAITAYTSVAENLDALYERIDAQAAQGFGLPTSYGGGGHDITPKAARALRIAGYTCVKGGLLGGVNLASYENPWAVCVGGSIDTAMQMGGTFVYFAHGVSSDPASESDPSLYVTAASFNEMLADVVAHRADGGCLVLNMRQWAQYNGLA